MTNFPINFNQRFAKRGLYRFLTNIEVGEIAITDPTGTTHFGKKCDTLASGKIHISNPTAFTAIALGGDIGLAESYIAGYWQTPNLTALLTVLARNANTMFAFDRRQSWLKKLRALLWHRQKKNTPLQSKLNILAHYDLGNALFEYFLDPHMMYSSAIYPSPKATLEEAQQNRLAIICQKLRLTPDDHLIEIGSGWGGLAIYAAQNYGCHVTTTTISDKQYQLCESRIKALNLGHKITLLQQDYRELRGQYDKLVSIEMIEAVGPQYYDQFFKQCSALLKPNGLMLLQSITTVDQRYEQVLNDVDMIKRYIFPGGHLPSMTVIQNNITQHTDLNLVDLHDITPHYALTLSAWRERFNRDPEKLKTMGFDEFFCRLWNYYLSYCEAGFKVRSVNVVQSLFAKPQWQFDHLTRI